VAGKAKADMAHSSCGWNAGCAGKTVLSVDNVFDTWAPSRCFVWRRYTNRLHLPLPYFYLADLQKPAATAAANNRQYLVSVLLSQPCHSNVHGPLFPNTNPGRSADILETHKYYSIWVCITPVGYSTVDSLETKNQILINCI